MQNKCPDAFKALKVILKHTKTYHKPINFCQVFEGSFLLKKNFQVFEGTGIKIVSDLPFLSQCETVIDANNVSDHEIMNFLYIIQYIFVN